MTYVAGRADPRQAYFDRLAPDWDRTGPDPRTTLARLRGLAGRLGLRAGLDVLEVGCGTGQISGWLAGQVAPGRVVAVDFAPGMLAQARARGLDVEFRRADVCEPGALEGRFDRVLCFHCFPHLREPAVALAQMRGCLTEGGELLVLHLAGSAPLNAFHAQIGGRWRATDYRPRRSGNRFCGRRGCGSWNWRTARICSSCVRWARERDQEVGPRNARNTRKRGRVGKLRWGCRP